MTQSKGDYNAFDPTGMLKGMRDANVDAWSKMMVDWVNSDVYAESTAAMLDAWLVSSGPFQKSIETGMAQTLAKLNLPTRDDVTRIAEHLVNIEMRLDDLEAKLDEAVPSSHLGEKQS